MENKYYKESLTQKHNRSKEAVEMMHLISNHSREILGEEILEKIYSDLDLTEQWLEKAISLVNLTIDS